MINKLAYLCSSKSWGGLEMNHLRNAQWMSQRGHQIIVIGVVGTPYHSGAIEMNLPFVSINPYRKYYDWRGAAELRKILIKKSITHLLIRSNYDMSVTATVKRLLKNELHTSYFMEMQLGVKKTGPHHTMRYGRIDVWSCPLQWLADQVKEMTHFRNELAVIPSGLNLSDYDSVIPKLEARMKLNLPLDGFIFGLIGRFDQKKGQLLFLEAMAKCKNDNFSVVFIGESTLGEGEEYKESITQFIRENRLEKRVSVNRARNDIATFYSAVDWVVVAASSETFGMVTIEALASGTPVLGSNIGGTPELLENEKGGLLFESMNIDDLASKISAIVEGDLKYQSPKLKAMTQKYDHNEICSAVEHALHLDSFYSFKMY